MSSNKNITVKVCRLGQDSVIIKVAKDTTVRQALRMAHFTEAEIENAAIALKMNMLDTTLDTEITVDCTITSVPKVEGGR